jgi:hypothetical protein
MANDENKINELVENDEEPTVKLQLPVSVLNSDIPARAIARTFDATPHLNSYHDAGDAEHLRIRLLESEKYADSIRQQSQDLIETNNRLEQEIKNLSLCLSDTKQKNIRLASEVAMVTAATEEMKNELLLAKEQHESEIRILRLELGEAQNTAVQSDEINSQLASDLVDSRIFKEELERMLDLAEQKSAERNQELEKQLARLHRETESLNQKLATKSEAVSILLAELAKKSEIVESIGEIEDAMHDTEESTSARKLKSVGSDTRVAIDHVTRVLVGQIDNQALRFPLVKNRLTIGRTKDNDIQLKAACISRHHAVVETDGKQTRIIDSGSTNGVQVNSEKIVARNLANGDVVTIGNALFKYEERKNDES